MSNRHEIPQPPKPNWNRRTKLNRAGVVAVSVLSAAGGAGLLVGGKAVLNNPTVPVNIKYGPGTSPSDAALALETVEGVTDPEPNSQATLSLASSIAKKIMQNHNVPQANDLQGGGTEPVIKPNQTFTYYVPAGHYPEHKKFVDANGIINLTFPPQPK